MGIKMRYCKIHKLDYMDYLSWCPICKGEQHPTLPKRSEADKAPRRKKKLKHVRKD